MSEQTIEEYVADQLGSEPNPSFDDIIGHVLTFVRHLVTGKARARGVANLVDQGLHGVLQRVLHDKLVRVRLASDLLSATELAARHGFVVTDRDGSPINADLEVASDDLIDTIGYMAIALMLKGGMLKAGMRIGAAKTRGQQWTPYTTRPEPGRVCVGVWAGNGSLDRVGIFMMSSSDGVDMVPFRCYGDTSTDTIQPSPDDSDAYDANPISWYYA